jgi:hypothetical protein
LGAIDAALLDRLDHTVEMPLPADALRLRYCLGLMQTRLQQYLSEEASTELGQLLVQALADAEKDEKGSTSTSSSSRSSVGAGGAGGGRRRRSRSELRANDSPELTPTPSSSSSSGLGPDSAADRTKRLRALEACISSLPPSSSSSSSFDVARASRELVVASVGWSLQDLERLVDRSVAACLGTEACVLSTRLFLLELKYLLEQK